MEKIKKIVINNIPILAILIIGLVAMVWFKGDFIKIIIELFLLGVGGFTYLDSHKILRKVLNFSSKVLLEINKTKPWFVCQGDMLCLNGELIKKINIPAGLIRIDGYLHLKTIKNGYDFVFLPDVRVQDTKDFDKL